MEKGLVRAQKSKSLKWWRVFLCSCRSAVSQMASSHLHHGSSSPQGRHRTHRFGRYGPKPHHEHERPRFCGKDPSDSRSVVMAPPEPPHPVSSKSIQQVCAFNRTVSKVHDFLQNEAKGSKVIGAESLEDMVSKLKKPRRVILLVKAGKAVDDFIDKLVGNICARLPCRNNLVEPVGS